MKTEFNAEEVGPNQAVAEEHKTDGGYSCPEEVHQRFLRELKRKGIRRVIIRL